MSCLDNPANSDILEWLPDGDGFLIKDKKRFGTEILPQVLKQTQYSSFTRRMNRWQFKLNNLGHKQASYHHPLFRRGRQDLAMQMAPIRQKQYGGGGDRNPSSRKLSKSVSTKATTNEAKTENKVDDSSSDDEDESMTDKDNRKHSTDRNLKVEGWKMEPKGPSSSSVASDAAYHTTGDQTSYHYNTTTTESNNVASYNVSSQSISVPKPQQMEMPYNHIMPYHMNMQHSMNHTLMQSSSSIPTSQSMPYHIQQSPHIEQSQHRLFPHIEQQYHQQQLPYPHQQHQQQSHPWMQNQAPMTTSQPSYPHQNHVSFPYAPPTVPIDNSRNPQELIEYHEKLIDYLSQYQSCLSNDMELSKRAIEHLKKDTTSKDENQS
jgi:hypothetical protein